MVAVTCCCQCIDLLGAVVCCRCIRRGVVLVVFGRLPTHNFDMYSYVAVSVGLFCCLVLCPSGNSGG